MFLIFTDRITPRCRYTMELVFHDLLGLPLLLTDRKEDFDTFEGPKMAYSDEHIHDALWISPAGLLGESGIRKLDPGITWKDDLPVCFPASNAMAIFPYDPFSAIFFFVSRYEEYLDHPKDIYGRFPARESLAFQHGFLGRPVVNLWAIQIKKMLYATYPGLSFREPSYRLLPTYDVDTAFAYAHKGLLRTAGGASRDLINGRWQNLHWRWNVLRGVSKDPFDTFDFILHLHKNFDLAAVSFFLVGDHGKNDPNNHYALPAMQTVMRKMLTVGPVGVHPSYYAADDPRQVNIEKERIGNVLGHSVTAARQHFIRLTLPDTYEWLAEDGIREDYSMGFPDMPGFRAGIATPYRFFNLRKEKELELTIYPFAFMDVTLKNYLKCAIPDAITLCSALSDQVKKVNGTLISVWHNESLSNLGEWEGWKSAYETIIQLASR